MNENNNDTAALRRMLREIADLAENASLKANAVSQDLKLPNQDAELARLSSEAILRYRALLEGSSDFQISQFLDRLGSFTPFKCSG